MDVSAARTVAGATNRFAVILVDARSGERTVLWYRDPALRLEPDDGPQSAAASGRLLLVDCDDIAAATVAAVALARSGIPTIIDVEECSPAPTSCCAQIDAIIAAEDFPPR